MNLNFLENITFRKSKNKSLTETHNISSDGSELDGSTSSLPNISCEENTIIQELKNEIEQLSSQLISAQEKISTLSTENQELKTNVLELKSELSLCQPLNKVTETLSRKKKNKVTNSPCIKSPQTKTNQTPNTQQDSSELKTTQRTRKPVTNDDINKQSPKKKICIISSNSTNKVLSIAQDTFKNTEICHYIYPECGILQLINNLNSKIRNFSKNDYCVILIGENDFSSTKNYLNLVMEIRNSLLEIQYTNLILCSPTYKLSNYSSVFNWRVEIFANLLYLDINTHNYAMLLDSNLELTYDYSMFSRFNGRLKNFGMKNIMCNLQILINDNITKINLNAYDTKLSTNQDFFL